MLIFLNLLQLTDILLIWYVHKQKRKQDKAVF